jgi:hypothetical protein
MENEQLDEIRKAVVALVDISNGPWLHWSCGPYKELKWVQHQPIDYAVECALVRIGNLLTSSERKKILRSLGSCGHEGLGS